MDGARARFFFSWHTLLLCSKLRSRISDAVLDNVLFLPKTIGLVVNTMQVPL